jgi:plasmid stabilization system protein ParE
MTAVRSLEQFSNRASQAPESAEFERDIRQLFVGKDRQYRLLFVVEKGRVSILYVRHSSQSWLSQENDK